MLALAVPGQRVKREPCASVERLVGACAGTSSLHDVPRILFVCTGSSAAFEGFEKDVGVRGFTVVFINLSGTAVLDWCDGELFRRVKDRITGGEFVAVVLSPPYSTFCRRFRGCIGADVYGLKGLRPDDKEVVRAETLIVFRCIEVSLIIHSMCMPWVLVLPAIPNFVFQLPEMHGLVQSPGVLERSLDVGDVLIGNINGECRSLVDSVTSGIRDFAVVFNGEPTSEPWPLEATVVDMDTQLRGPVVNPKSLRKVEDEECIGGMVRAARAVASLPGNLVVGGQVRTILDSFLVEFPHVVDDCYHAIGSDSENAGPKLQDLEAFRIRLGSIWGLKIGARLVEIALRRSVMGCCLRGLIWRMIQGK